MMTAANLRAPGGGEAALAALVTSLRTRLLERIPPALASLDDWRIDDTGKVVLYADTSGRPLPIQNLDVKTLNEEGSLVIGIDYLGRQGAMVNLTGSTLRVRRARLDSLGITVNNRMLLRGVIQPALRE